MNNKRANRTKHWIAIIGAGLFIATMMILGQAPVEAADGVSYTVKFVNNEFEPAAGVDQRLIQASEPTGRWHGLIQIEPQNAVQTALELDGLGVKLLQYIPDNTWMASFPASYDDVMTIDAVRWVGVYQGSLKLDAVLQDVSKRSSFIINGNQLPLRVRIFDDVAIEKAVSLLTAYATNGIETEAAARLLRLTITIDQLDSISNEDLVEFVSIDLGGPGALLDGARTQANVDTVHAAPYNLSGNGINVVVFDEGVIDSNHPDFTGRVIIPEAYDISTHATHVGGIVASNGSNSLDQGYSEGQMTGFAPAANLISYTWSNPIGRHDTAINSYGADISQNSWGYNHCNYFGMYILYAADFDGIVTGDFGDTLPVIFAAGNTHNWCGIGYGSVLGGPSTAKNVLTVGATTKAGTIVSYSAYGPTQDGRLKPEVVAVGHSVYSPCPGERYCRGDGTSMAAPAVSGTAALLLEEYRNSCTAKTGPAGELLDPLPATFRSLLIHSATDLDNVTDDSTLGPDFASGYGALNASAAIDLLPYFFEGTITDGATLEYIITVSDEDSLKATLVWDDPKAAHNAAITLINDLDIEVIAPDGTTVYGPWLLDPTEGNQGNAATRPTWSNNGTPQRDQINVIEQVLIDNPQAGDWTIRIIGSNIPNGPQSFSLVNEQLGQSSCTGFNGTLNASQSAADVQLSWSDIDAYNEFEVYRSTVSGFTPGDSNTTLLATIDGELYSEGQTINFSDNGIIDGAVATYFYAIRGIAEAGTISGLSNEVGKVDFTLIEGQLNTVTWNLVTEIDDSDSLQTHIESNSSSPLSIRFIESWDEIAQSYRAFSRNPFTFGLFDVVDSASYRVVVDVPAGNSSVWTLVGDAATENGLVGAPEAATSPALYYGQLTGAASGSALSYIGWTGSASGAPAEIITEDSFNVGDGEDQGYQNDYWLINLNNLNTPPVDGEQINLIFGGTSTTPSTLWRHAFTYSQAAENSDQGSVASAGSTSCPDLVSVARVGEDNYINFNAPAGTYLIYRSQQAAVAEADRSNGRYQYLATVTTSGSSGSYIDLSLEQSWYIVVPADSGENINGCHSLERGTSAPTAIQLNGVRISGDMSSSFLFIGMIAAAFVTMAIIVRPLLGANQNKLSQR